MRLAFVVPGGLQRVSGGFIYDRQLIAALRARGATVDVVPLPWLPFAVALASNLVPWSRALRGYDVVIEDELCHPAVVGRRRRARAGGAPVVALVHNLACRQLSTRHRRLRGFIERAYLRGVDGVAAVCASTLADVEQLAGCVSFGAVAPAGRDHVAAHDADAVAARAHERGPLRVLFAGTVTPAKGLHRLVDVLSALVRAGHDLSVDVAGAVDQAPSYGQMLRERVAEQRLLDRVRWHGLLHGDALWALYRRCHVLALPSAREAYPLVAIEALASGLPVLITDQGGTRELLATGPHALLLPPDDQAAWTQALISFAGDRNALAAAGQSALARFAALGTWADAADAVLALCRRLCHPAR
ncbi:MAG TPA: glycosyltransferase family 4 protein [Polyangia bacterium]|jgi:glycosyltransferase involved in cell wall biosynthesis|nr:glycosyltransferase family 4 protein [Polyangia bacterium]